MNQLNTSKQIDTVTVAQIKQQWAENSGLKSPNVYENW